MRRLAGLLILPVLLADAQEPSGPTITTADRSFPVRRFVIRAQDGEPVLEFEDAKGARGSLPCVEVVEISLGPQAARAAAGPDDVQVLLRTGDSLFGALQPPPGPEALKIAGGSLGETEIPLNRIEEVRFLARRAKWLKTAPAIDKDTLIVDSGDRHSGSVTSAGRGQVSYYNERRKREVPIPTGDLVQIFFVPLAWKPPALPDTLYGLFQLADGSSIQGILRSFGDGSLVFADLFGTERRVSTTGVSAIFFRNGRVIYLSDVAPSRVDENPNFIRGPVPQPSDLAYPFQRDANAGDGGRLSIRGREFRKGIGVHARSEISYALDGKYSRFQATIGIDDHALRLTGFDQAGQVDFVVLADGNVLERRDGVTSKLAPVLLDVSVKDVRELTLLVDFGGDLSGTGDFADWALARLIR